MASSEVSSANNIVYQYYNCLILWRHKFIREDLWVRNGIILDPKMLFFDECKKPDIRIDCHGLYIVPGFIDVQINGGFSVDFSSHENVEEGIQKVAKGLLGYGVTSFCPTIVTSPRDVYHKMIPRIKIRNGSKDGAGVLGIHVEGPFISKKKKGAHPEDYIIEPSNGIKTVEDVYGSLECIKMLTIAPELPNASEVIKQLVQRGIVVSLGHSVGNVLQAEAAVNNGASFITHLFNAMLPFHHRDPGIVGLLTSSKIAKNRKIYYGMITDGIHSHPAALRIAHRANPEGLVLVTDAISAMGLPPGVHKLGQQSLTISGFTAHLTGTDTLAGSVATMPYCIKHFHKATGCSMEQAIEAATLHPAESLHIDDKKGTLEYSSDADFVMIDESFQILKTFIAGEMVYSCD
ncbi:N-acetylglucosamine-6-phosphate deacetylase-like [Styela clava]